MTARKTKHCRACALTPRQTIFCQEYAAGASGAQAAIVAGYARRSADVQAVRLLAKPSIRAKIDGLLRKSAEAARLNIERVDQAIAQIAFSDVRRLFRENGTMKSPSEWDPDLAAAVASFEVTERRVGGRNGKGRHVVRVVRVRLADRIGALTLGAKRLGMLKDQIKHSGSPSLENLITAAMGRKAEKEKTS
jgi:phage terminase small subunit